MTSTITGTHTSAVTLATGTYSNPVYVTGTIDVATGIALQGASGTAWTVTNEGLIRTRGTARFAHDFGVALASGGEIINQASATIIGFAGAYVTGAVGTVVNAGTISGGKGGYYGVELAAGGTVINQSGGTISGLLASIYIGNATGTVTNAGELTSPNRTGVYLVRGGSITNQTGGTIITGGSTSPAVKFGAAGTLDNAGTVTGGSASAVGFAAGFDNLLIVRPGAVFSGVADGGNTIGATAVSTLELASGASEGTLTGLGSEFINFAQVTVDAGAYWTLSGQTIGSGVTLTNAGTVGSSVLLAAYAHLTNAAGGLINAGTETYAVFGTSAATMLNFGT